VTVHVPVPEHAPLQPAKLVPMSGAAVSVTVVPLGKLQLHVAPQEMPAGELVTVPLPAPDLLTDRMFVAPELNVAVTLVKAFSVTVHVPVPEHAPLQPAKLVPMSGVAVSVTVVPLGKLQLHVAPQEMPDGELVTVPVPAPDLLTDKICVGPVNDAVTFLAVSMVTTQFPVPEQAPLQPVNVEPDAGVAVIVNVVPNTRFGATQETLHPRLIGVLVTMPEPLPAMVSDIGVRMAASAMMMPAPVSTSTPAAMTSMAVAFNRAMTCALVRLGFADFSSAAIAAAWGAAAEVPQKGMNFGVVVTLQSPAAMSTFGNSVPPPPAQPNVEHPGVM
jgi:hypothetical protein